MKPHNSILILCALSFLLISCNNGSSHENNLSMTGKQLNGATAPFGSPLMLGNPANFAGDWVESHGTPFQNALCIDSNSLNVQMSTETGVTSKTDSYIVTDSAVVTNQVFTNVTAGGGYGLFKASVDAKNANEYSTDENNLTFVTKTIQEIPLLANIDLNEHRNGCDLMVKDVQEMCKHNLRKFAAKCGNGFVNKVGLEKTITVVYTLHFENSAIKNRFEFGAEVNYGSFFNLKEQLKNYTSNYHTRISIDISAKVDGGPIIPQMPFCTINDIDSCDSRVTNAVDKFLKANEQDITDLIAWLRTPHRLNDVIPRVNGFAYTNDIGFTNYRDPSGSKNYFRDIKPYDYEKEHHNVLENMLKQSTGLAANGPLVKQLQEIIPQIDSPDFIKEADIITNASNKVSEATQYITSPEFIQNMLFSCYSFESQDIESKSYCHDFMNQPVIPYGKDPITQETIRKSVIDYIDELNHLAKMPSFLKQGYYSAADPNLANFFWFPVETETHKIYYYPISLNYNLEDICVKSFNSPTDLEEIIPEQRPTDLSNGIFGLKYKDWDSNRNIITKFLPLPHDLYIEMGLSDNQISNITRHADSMTKVKINEAPYHSSVLNCHPTSRYSYNSSGKGQVINGFECGDSINGNSEPMYNFYQSPEEKNNTLAAALLFYGEKPFTNGQVPGQDSIITHVDTHKNGVCNNIGNKYLSPSQPWCPNDDNNTGNKYCLTVDPTQVGNNFQIFNRVNDSYPHKPVASLGSIPTNAEPMAVEIKRYNNYPGLFYFDSINGQYESIGKDSPTPNKLITINSNNLIDIQFNSGTGEITVLDPNPKQDSFYHEVTTPENITNNSKLKLNQRWYSASRKHYLTLSDNKLIMVDTLTNKNEKVYNVNASADYGQIEFGDGKSFKFVFYDKDHNVVGVPVSIEDTNNMLGLDGIKTSALFITEDQFGKGRLVLINYGSAFTYNQNKILDYGKYNSLMDILDGDMGLTPYQKPFNYFVITDLIFKQ